MVCPVENLNLVSRQFFCLLCMFVSPKISIAMFDVALELYG